MIERIVSRKNLLKARRHVEQNKGSSGVDRMPVSQLKRHVELHRDVVLTSILNDSYEAQPILGVVIPKGKGKTRQLGVPTVIERMLQQAVSRKEAKERQFDFLGYTFRSRNVKTKEGTIIFGFSPSISGKSTKRITEEGRQLGFHRWTHLDIVGLSNMLRSKIRGWLNYYGKFHKSAVKVAFRHLNRRIVKWAYNKYKRFKRRKALRAARLWLRQLSKEYAYLFPMWQHGFTP